MPITSAPPRCLLAGSVLSEAIGERGIRIQWRAFELRRAIDCLQSGADDVAVTASRNA